MNATMEANVQENAGNPEWAERQEKFEALHDQITGIFQHAQDAVDAVNELLYGPRIRRGKVVDSGDPAENLNYAIEELERLLAVAKAEARKQLSDAGFIPQAIQ